MGWLGDTFGGALSSITGGFISKDANRDTWGLNRDMQREFAQKGIQWKVADAKAAGLHPLAALGAQGTSFAPMAVGDTLGPAVAAAGQDISRAMAANATAAERGAANATAAALGKLAIEKGTLENELLRQRVAAGVNGTGPAMPPTTYPVRSGDVTMSALTTDSVGRGVATVEPVKIPSSHPTRSDLTAGTQPGGTIFDFGPAGKWVGMSENAAQSFEDMDLAKYAAVAAMNWPELEATLGTNFARQVGRFKRDMEANRRILLNLALNKPAWVKQLERERGWFMRPVHKDGHTYWKPD